MSSYPSQIPDFTKLPTFKADLAAIGETLHLYSQTLDNYSRAFDTKILDNLDALFRPDAFLVSEPHEVLTGVGPIKTFISDWSSTLFTTAHKFHIDNVLDYNPGDVTVAYRGGTAQLPASATVHSHFEVMKTSKDGKIATYGADATDWLSPHTDPNTKVITWQFRGRRMRGGLF